VEVLDGRGLLTRHNHHLQVLLFCDHLTLQLQTTGNQDLEEQAVLSNHPQFHRKVNAFWTSFVLWIILPWLVGPGPPAAAVVVFVVAPRPSAAGKAPGPQTPSKGVQPGDCPAPTHCAAAQHTPVPPQTGSAPPGDVARERMVKTGCAYGPCCANELSCMKEVLKKGKEPFRTSGTASFSFST